MISSKLSTRIDKKIVDEAEIVLKSKGYNTLILHNEKEVDGFINKLPTDKIIALGDSITTCKLKIRNILTRKGSLIFYSWNGDDDYNRTMDTFEEHPIPDYYLSRINAVTLHGDILIKDYSREAVIKKSFPMHFIGFAGINRIVEEFNDSPSISKYALFRQKPEGIDFTIVLLPFMSY